MTITVRNRMTTSLVCVDAAASVMDAARAMRDSAVGDVLVTRDGRLCGLATDRDLVVRCLAEGHDPRRCEVGAIASEAIVTIEAGADLEEAVALMKDHAVRRLPVLDGSGPSASSRSGISRSSAIAARRWGRSARPRRHT